MIDARAGLTPTTALRRSRAPQGQAGGARRQQGRGARRRGGMHLGGLGTGSGRAVAISAEHGQGMPDLRDAIVEALGEARLRRGRRVRKRSRVFRPTCRATTSTIPTPRTFPEYDATKPLRIAVVGRPNAGKSTLINALLGQERLLTGPEAGITRDSISVDWEWRGRRSSCSTRPACGASRGSRKSWKSCRSPTRCARSASPKSSSSCSTRPSPSRSRTCRSPISSSARAGRRCSPSTSGT
jgi:hypothetical protein